MTVCIIQGDCREVMAGMPEASFDAIVTDPPYGLEFMGKEWDRLWHQSGKSIEPFKGTNVFANPPRYGRDLAQMQAWHEQWAHEAYRVLKPGGHIPTNGAHPGQVLVSAMQAAGYAGDTLGEVQGNLPQLFG